MFYVPLWANGGSADGSLTNGKYSFSTLGSRCYSRR